MYLHHSSPWPMKSLITCAMYYGAADLEVYLFDANQARIAMASLMVVEIAIFLPSVLFAVRCRRATVTCLTQSIAYISVLATCIAFCSTRYPEICRVALPFAASHLLFRQYDEACAHRSFNNAKVVSWITFCASVAFGVILAFECKRWPKQFVLLPCIMAGELLGIVASAVHMLVYALSNVLETFIQSM